MQYKETTALRKINAMKKRLKIIQGGSSAGKTIALLLILINRAQTEKGKLFSIVSETLPHLKKGAIRDFINIMDGHLYFDDNRWNKTESTYTFETGTKIEFFGADSADKVRGPRRDVLFINEANNINFETYTQLAIRTNEDIYIDYNPVSEFWVHTEIIQRNVEHDFIIITYLDNEGLPESIVKELESRKTRKGFWQVYGLGQLGEVEGKIYKDWAIIDEVPHNARLLIRGLDYGYSNDPSAIISIYKYDGGYIFHENLYQKGMSNKQIADFIKNLDDPQMLIVADSAEPKSNDELLMYGINLLPATKGPGSVNQGIQRIQDERISVTKNSYNLIKEYRNYLWKTDRDGKVLNDPEGGQDHLLDAARYSMSSIAAQEIPRQFYQENNNLHAMI